MNRGFLKLYRKIQDNDLWLEKPFSPGQAWIDILLLANIRESSFVKRGVEINVKKGQMAISEKGLSERWGWSRGKVDRFLRRLENRHQIEHQKNNVTTLITIINYDDYNNNEHQNEPQTDTKRTPNGHQTDTSKEVKKLRSKEVKNNKPLKSEKFSDDDMKLAVWIYEKIDDTIPNTKKPNLEKWANTVRLMVERDNLTHREIAEVFLWANKDSFWQTNILSPSKLREKFGVLKTKKKNDNGTQGKKSSTRQLFEDLFGGDDYVDKRDSEKESGVIDVSETERGTGRRYLPCDTERLD